MSAVTRGLRLGGLAASAIAPLLCVALAAPAQAASTGPWWSLDATAAPSILPTHGEAQIVVIAVNVGDGSVQASAAHPVTLTDTLPAGLTVSGAPKSLGTGVLSGGELSCAVNGQVVTCTSATPMLPFEPLTVRIPVQTSLTAGGELSNIASVSGVDTTQRDVVKPLRVGSSPSLEQAPFGVESFALNPEAGGGEGEHAAGEAENEAGSHPFQLTTTFDLNQSLIEYHFAEGHCGECGPYPSAANLPENLHFDLPPGMVGSAVASPRCTNAAFVTEAALATDLCPGDTAVGVASVLVNLPTPAGFGNLSMLAVPVFNLEPASGEPARFGFYVKKVPVVLRTAIPNGGEYGVQASVEYASQAGQFLSSKVTLWGVPDDPRHDSARGWECMWEGGYWREKKPFVPCEPHDEAPPKAFLTLPTSCKALAPATVSGNSWAAGVEHPAQTLQGEPTPEGHLTTEAFLPEMEGCGSLAFDPALELMPETTRASTPTGLQAGVNMDQTGLTYGEGKAEPALQDTTVTLPEGMQVNPSSANGLQACSERAIGYVGRKANGILEFEEEEAEQLSGEKEKELEEEGERCPKASKLGEVEIETPLVEEKLTGDVYLAEPAPDGEGGKNPFDSLVSLYIVVENPKLGVLVKLAGEGRLDPKTGQMTTVFGGTPQVPFSHLKLHLFGGERAPLGTPSLCRGYQASAVFAGWSEELSKSFSQPPFQITAGPGGGACPGGTLPFSPSVQAGPGNSQAAAFTPFVFRIGQADGAQPLEKIEIHLPPGDSAQIAKVTPCSASQAQADACGPASLIGHSTAVAGLGDEPVALGGRLYLTGPVTVDGRQAPFGVLDVTRAKAGPFDLGDVSVLSGLTIDPTSATATITSAPIPDYKDGVPVDIKQLEVVVDRPQFTFNPTNCGTALTIGGSLSGYEGGSVGIGQPYPVTGCASLPFKPTFAASATGHASKANGTAFTVKVTSAGIGQANIAKVSVQLPKQLPSRLTTIQKACTAATFEANPAGCPEGSNIGTATVHTPVLDSPVTGPAYLVSHGGAAFPDIEFVLQGEGVKLVLDGKTDIKKGITYSKFESVPDQPFTSFETVFPAGPHSALTANVAESKKYDLCGEKLAMPTTLVAQNGAVIEQTTNISLEGCGAVEGNKVHKLTLAQQLKNALAKCRTKYKHSKTKRLKCERAAHAHYTAIAIAACHKKDKHAKKKLASCEATARRQYGVKPASHRGKGKKG
jgi:hypothetical protein